MTNKKDMATCSMTGKHIFALILSFLIVLVSTIGTFPLDNGVKWFVGINVVNIILLVMYLYNLDTKQIELYNKQHGINK